MMASSLGSRVGSSTRLICKFPGCTRLRYREQYGYTHDFCGRTHAELFRKTYGTDSLGSDISRRNTAGGLNRNAASTNQPLKASHSISLPTTLGRRLGSSSAGESKLYSTNEIRFYNRDEPYYEFTNFYPCFIEIDKTRWPTSEHYFQAQKFVGTPYVQVIKNLRTAREAFQLSRDPKVSRWRRADWETVKDDIMLKALRCKFTQEHLARKLLETGEKKLIEHTFNDSYWGDGGDGTGQNKLGKLLMQVRQELQASTKYGDLVTKKFPRSGLRRSASLSRISPIHSTTMGTYNTTTSRDDLDVWTHTQVHISNHLETRGRSSSFSTLLAAKDQSRCDPSYSHNQSSPFLRNGTRKASVCLSKPTPSPSTYLSSCTPTVDLIYSHKDAIPPRSGLRRSASLSTLHRISPSHSTVMGTTTSHDDLDASAKDQSRRDPSYNHHQSNRTRETLIHSSKPTTSPLTSPMPGYTRGGIGSKSSPSPTVDLYSHKDVSKSVRQSPSTSSKLPTGRDLCQSFNLPHSDSSTHAQHRRSSPPRHNNRPHVNKSSVQYNIISSQ